MLILISICNGNTIVYKNHTFCDGSPRFLHSFLIHLDPINFTTKCLNLPSCQKTIRRPFLSTPLKRPQRNMILKEKTFFCLQTTSNPRMFKYTSRNPYLYFSVFSGVVPPNLYWIWLKYENNIRAKKVMCKQNMWLRAKNKV